jgi:hypothetical protein
VTAPTGLTATAKITITENTAKSILLRMKIFSFMFLMSNTYLDEASNFEERHLLVKKRTTEIFLRRSGGPA